MQNNRIGELEVLELEQQNRKKTMSHLTFLTFLRLIK